jgi:hypothetical protein
MKNSFEIMRDQIMKMQAWFAEYDKESKDPDVVEAVKRRSLTRGILEQLMIRADKEMIWRGE